MTNSPENRALPPTGAAGFDPRAAIDFALREIGPTTLVTLDPERRWSRGFWLDENTREAAVGWVRNSGAVNVYFCPNAPRAGMNGKPKKADVALIRALYADIDAKDGRTLAEARAAIAKVPIPPTIVIMSGGGYQPLWMLREPLPTTTENTAWAEAVGQKIAALVEGDGVQNIDRILRLPFTVNFPNARKRAAGRSPTLALVETAGGRRYTREEVEGALGHVAASGAARQDGAVIPLPGSPPAVLARLPQQELATAAEDAANPPGSQWFDELPPERMNELLRAIAASPAGLALADQERPEWLKCLFAFADAETRGADEARTIALDWCKTSPRFQDEGGFNRDWQSFNGRPDGVRVATLIKAAAGAGFDLRTWRPTAAASPSPLTTVMTKASAELTSGPVALTAIPPKMDAAEALALMNSTFVFVHNWGGEPMIGHRQLGGSTRAIDEKQLLRSLASRRVVVPGRDGETQMPLGKWWLAHPERREVDRAVFEPERGRGSAPAPYPVETKLNLWTGLARQPAVKPWRLIRKHLFDVICSRDRASWRYLFKWLAHAVQYPGKAPGTVIVLRSDSEGTGKSTVLEIMKVIFGEHGILLNTPEGLIGDFNDHLERCCFIGLNEPSFPGDHRAAAKLKSMITESTWTINGKYRAARQVPNIAHIMMTTNQAWAIPAGNKARRFLMLDIDGRAKEEPGYFSKLWAEIDNGGIEGFLNALLRIRVDHDELRDVPRTAALRRQQLLSAPSMVQWAADAAHSGELIPPDPLLGPSLPGGGFGQDIPGSALYRSYVGWCRLHRQRPESHVTFGRWLAGCNISSRRSNGATIYQIPDPTAFAGATLGGCL